MEVGGGRGAEFGGGTCLGRRAGCSIELAHFNPDKRRLVTGPFMVGYVRSIELELFHASDRDADCWPIYV
jgi:hypothetical protein